MIKNFAHSMCLIILYFVYWLGTKILRLQFKCAQTENEIEACMDLRKKIFEKDLSWVDDGKKTFHSLFDHLDNVSDFCMVKNKKGTVIASYRITKIENILQQGPPVFLKNLDITSIPKEILVNSVYFSRFCKEKKYHNVFLQLLGIIFLLKYMIANNRFIVLGTCHPSLYPLYHKFGTQVYSNLIKIDSHYLCNIYLDIFRKECPFNFVSRKFALDEALDRKRELFLKKSQHFDSILRVEFNKPYNHPLFKKISKRTIDKLFQSAILMKIPKSHPLYTAGESGSYFGIIVQGCLEVIKNNKSVAILKEGEVFGGLGYFLNKKRNATLIPTSTSQVIIFSKSFFGKFINKDEKSQFLLNLLEIIASRKDIGDMCEDCY